MEIGDNGLTGLSFGATNETISGRDMAHRRRACRGLRDFSLQKNVIWRDTVNAQSCRVFRPSRLEKSVCTETVDVIKSSVRIKSGQDRKYPSERLSVLSTNNDSVGRDLYGVSIFLFFNKRESPFF